jgi:hypothetical protein
MLTLIQLLFVPYLRPVLEALHVDMEYTAFYVRLYNGFSGGRAEAVAETES